MKNILFFLTLLAPIANADKTCGPYKIELTEIVGTYAHFNPVDTSVNMSWQTLGDLNTPGTKERYSSVLAAQMAGKMITVRFEDDNHNCSAYNKSDPAIMVRIHSDG